MVDLEDGGQNSEVLVSGQEPAVSAGYEALPMAGEPPSAVDGGAATTLILDAGKPGLESGDAAADRHDGQGELACSFHLAKAILGVGVTALPHAFLLLGAVPAVLTFLGVACLTFFSCHSLVRGLEATGKSSYSGVMTAQLGRWAAVVLDLSLVVNCFGMLTVYLIVAGDVLTVEGGDLGIRGPAGNLLGPLHHLMSNRRLVLACVALFILAPLVSIKRLKHTTFVSVLGVGAIAVWAAATLFLSASLEVKGEGHPVRPWPKWEQFSGPYFRTALKLTAVVPVVLCAFICQMAFFPIVKELRPYRGAGMRRASAAAITACLLLFATLALGSQVLFGESIAPNVLQNFRPKEIQRAVGGSRSAAAAVAWAVRMAYLLSILASYPLQMKPFRDALAWLWGGDRAVAAFNKAPGFYFVTYATLAAAYVAATSLPSIWVALEFVGATAGALIAFVLPGLLTLSLSLELSS